MSVKLGVYGVRGSAPISGSAYIKYGGNTSSYTIRTPANTLIFLDAGTGLRIADGELDEKADQVYLVISHTHADHIQGFGMTRLPYLNNVEGYEDQCVNIIGPPGVIDGLSKFYDGDLIWPVKFSDEHIEGPRMFGIDYSKIQLYSHDLQVIQIDKSTDVTLMKGNHPVRGGVILYRFRMKKPDGNPVIIVYATDNEFDFVSIDEPNPIADQFKHKYREFIRYADVLIADAQYTKHDYYQRFKGFGHSYHQQIIDIADKSAVQLLLLTHHHLYEDDILDDLKGKLDQHLEDHHSTIKVQIAQEGHVLEF